MRRLLVISLISLCHANVDNMFDLILQLEELAMNKSITAGVASEDDRAFVGTIATKLTDLDHYGCWCYFDDDWLKAKGPVQDGLDAECKVLVNGYQCLVADALERGHTCDPMSQVYETYDILGGDGDIVADCAANSNGDLPEDERQCAIDLCVVEGTFSVGLFALLLAGIADAAGYDANLAHPENAQDGPFDPAVECATNIVAGHGQSEKECCGAYPTRFPYKTFGGDRDCCGTRTFNTQTLVCCIDPEDKDNRLSDFVQDIANTCPSVD